MRPCVLNQSVYLEASKERQARFPLERGYFHSDVSLLWWQAMSFALSSSRKGKKGAIASKWRSKAQDM